LAAILTGTSVSSISEVCVSSILFFTVCRKFEITTSLRTQLAWCLWKVSLRVNNCFRNLELNTRITVNWGGLRYFQMKIEEKNWIDFHSATDGCKLAESRNVCKDNRYVEIFCLRFEVRTSSIRGKYHVGGILVCFQKAMRECVYSAERARILGGCGSALGGAELMDAALRLRSRKSMRSSFPTACPENIRLPL
jgi:hypothetical protein